MIRLSKSSISYKEIFAVINVLRKEYLGMGTKVMEFEKNLESYFGRPAVCVVNGTAALHLSVQACGIGKGDQVLVPTVTYLASFQAIAATGAEPIPCDINPKTGYICLEDCQKKLSKKTKAIMPVHFTGGVANIIQVLDFAQINNLRVIEDAAHAFGSTHENKKIGSFGDISCFSFDGIKNITSGEGGCVVSSDYDIINKIKDARLLGIERDTENRYKDKRSWNFDVKSQGWRYHMSNIMAAIGIQQLKRFDKLSGKRKAFAKFYDSLIDSLPNISYLDRNYNEIVPHIYVVIIDPSVDRNEIRKKMLEKGVETGVHYIPNHLLTYFKSKNTESFPGAKEFYNNSITLPLHPDLSYKKIQFIVDTINGLVNNG